jgi:hemerythrin superfamily protein
MPDAIEMLKADHREVEELFGKYKSTRSPEIVREICTELTVHAALEEKLVYPLLEEKVDGGKAMRDHAEEEHQEVKDAIFEIERLGYGDPGVEAHMATIIEGVTEHVREEESEVLPALRDRLTAETMTSVTQEAEATKAELLASAKTAGPLIDLTKAQLYELAQEKDIPGRSEMTKEELISALARAS